VEFEGYWFVFNCIQSDKDIVTWRILR